MSFYLRKSIRVGPIRFNLSKSGIGVSAGITGFRVGTGPRGNYVHMGRGGVYYRKTLSPSDSSRSHTQTDGETNPDANSQRGVGPMVEIESGDVTAMVDSSSAELLQELNEKKRKIRIAPVIIILAVLFSAALFFALIHPVIQVALILAWIVAVYRAFRRDALVKTVVLVYAFDEVLERAYGALHEASARLASCAGHWHIAASSKVYERKYHAGASSLVDRKPTPIRRMSPRSSKRMWKRSALAWVSRPCFYFLIGFSSTSQERLEQLDMRNSISRFLKRNSLSGHRLPETPAWLVRRGNM